MSDHTLLEAHPLDLEPPGDWSLAFPFPPNKSADAYCSAEDSAPRIPFFGLVPWGDAGLGDRRSVMDPLRRLSDRSPLTVASLSLFLDRRSCTSISSSPPSASFSRSREVALESEPLSPFARIKSAPATGRAREPTVLPVAAYGVRPGCRV